MSIPANCPTCGSNRRAAHGFAGDQATDPCPDPWHQTKPVATDAPTLAQISSSFADHDGPCEWVAFVRQQLLNWHTARTAALERRLAESLECERQLSDAYVGLRKLLPGAFNTPPSPTPQQVWNTAEAAAKALSASLQKAEQDRDSATAKLDFLKSKGLTVGMLKDGHGERLAYVAEPDSEFDDTKYINKMIDAEQAQKKAEQERDEAKARFSDKVMEIQKHYETRITRLEKQIASLNDGVLAEAGPAFESTDPVCAVKKLRERYDQQCGSIASYIRGEAALRDKIAELEKNIAAREAENLHLIQRLGLDKGGGEDMIDLLTRQNDSLRSRLSQSPWQPIEAAPKKGIVGGWQDGGRWLFGELFFENDEWIDVSMGDHVRRPTVWCQLPSSPPVTQATEEPFAEDGHDHEGFAGGCRRMGHDPESCPERTQATESGEKGVGRCPICGSPEVTKSTPRTTYACGSSDYDQRPNTFHHGADCKQVHPYDPWAVASPDPLAEVKAAFAEGKRVQFRILEWEDVKNPSWLKECEYRIHPDDAAPKWVPKFSVGQEVSWLRDDAPDITVKIVGVHPNDVYEIEIAPGAMTFVKRYDLEPYIWSLPAPPEGQQWHRDDWTEDMLPEGWRPLLLGEIRQYGDECCYKGEWQPTSDTTECTTPSHLHYRTRRPLPSPAPSQFEAWFSTLQREHPNINESHRNAAEVMWAVKMSKEARP